MTRLVVRRRWLTPRRLIAVAVVAAVGVVVAVVIGHGNRAAGTADVPQEPAMTAVCMVHVHSVESAAVRAVEGLHAIALANMGQADVETTLNAYVTPDRRPLVRAYLKAYPAPFVALASTVLGWRMLTYTPDKAHLLLATSDVATTPTGEQKASQSITDVTLVWDGAQDVWRLADWKVNASPSGAVLDGGQRMPCG